MNQQNVIINNNLLPYFCKDCKYPRNNNEEDKICKDLCIHPNNRPFFESRDAECHATSTLLKYNDNLINKRI